MRSECKEKYMCGIAGFYNAEGNYQQQKEKNNLDYYQVLEQQKNK